MALSLYRKYRPNVFSDVVGQEHVEKTLVNAVTDGNVAHAYLFCGPRGTGKTTTARLLAKALLCESGPNAEPDGTCPECLDIAQGTHPDVYELDAASRTGVENVREEIIGRVNFAPTRGRYKVYIIDEVHMLSAAAFNALLKTLEEPPDHVVFVLCTTDPQKVLETILSRCQRFDFKRLSIDEIVSYLERICRGEGFTYETEALAYIATKSNGGMRDATTSLEQLSVFGDGAITLAAATELFGQMDKRGLFAFADAIARRDTAACFTQIAHIVANGADLPQFAHELCGHIRDLYVTALAGGGTELVKCTSEEVERYTAQVQAFGEQRLSRALAVCGELIVELRHSTDARLSLEIACTRLCRPESDLTLEALEERIASLEQSGVAAGAAGPTFGAVPAPGGYAAPVADLGFDAPEPQEERVASERRVASAEPPERETPVEHEAPSERMPWDDPVDEVPREQPSQAAHDSADAAGTQGAARGSARDAAQQASAQQQAGATRGSASMSPARVLQAVLTEIRREDVATGALLNGVDIAFDGEGYHLLFPASASFAMTIASKDSARDRIFAAFEHVCGGPVRVDFRPASASADGPAWGGGASSFEGDAGYTDAAGSAGDAADTGSAGSFAPDTEADDGYFEALEASVGYYDDAAPSDAGFAVAPMQSTAGASPSFSEPSFDEPNFDDPLGEHSAHIDKETEASLADTLSAFGSGIKFEEID